MELVLQGINYFAKKEKLYGLDEREKEMRQELRENYLRLIRLSFQDQIEHVKVIDEEGTDVTPAKLKGIQRGKQLHNRHLEHQTDLPDQMMTYLNSLDQENEND